MSSSRPDVTLLGRLTAHAAPLVPKPIVRQFGKPYVAGDTLEDAVRTVETLRQEGLETTVDILGESVTSDQGAADVANAYVHTLETMQARGLTTHLSLKASGLGSAFGWDVCGREIERVVRHAQEHGSFVRIDMEDATTVDATLSMYRSLRASGLTSVGIVLQSRLWRTFSDIASLASLAPNVRLCKGIYLERPVIGMLDYEAIRSAFVHDLRRLLTGGSYVGIATHDEKLIVEALAMVDELGLSHDSYEFQMLLGVRGDLARWLVGAGHTVRLYVPYGSDSLAYSQRRMRENPEMAGHIAKAVLQRMAEAGSGALTKASHPIH